jgi:hypothetical protein
MKTKTLSALLAILVFSGFAMAQKDPVDRLFDKYSGQEGFTTVYISSKMFSLFADMDPEDEELQQMMNGLKSIRILATDDESDAKHSNVNFFEEIMKDLPMDQYEELMVVKDAEQDLKFLIREDKGHVAELLLVGGGEGDNVLISIRGIIDMKNIAKITRAMDLEGLESLENLEKK